MATTKSSRASSAKAAVSEHNHSDLEARIAKLEAAVKQNEAEILKCAKRCLAISEDLKAPAPAPASAGGKDPRVDELQGKLRQLVRRLSRTRGNVPDWPNF